MTAMVLIVLAAWVLSLTPVAHAIVPPDRFGAINGLLIALLGPGVALKVLNRK